jgi:TRAP-type mannitol/chloroaromatic compound transport system substrate-binding protein
MKQFSTSRRTLLSSALGSTAALGVGLFYNRQPGSKQVNWTMHSFLGDDAKDKVLLYKVPYMISKRIADITDNNFKINVISSGGSTELILKDVGSSTKYECGFSGIYYETKENRALYFGCAIPFGLSPHEQTAWLSYKEDDNDDLTLIQKLYQDLGLNIIPFPAAATGGQMGGWFREELTTPESLTGKRMRIPGLGAKVFQKLGVRPDSDVYPKALLPQEIAPELEKGKSNNKQALDAAEWIGPYDDIRLNLDKAGAKYYYYPGWWEPSTTFDVQVNIDAWKSLSNEYQAIFKHACKEIYDDILTKYVTKNSRDLKILIKRKIHVQRFPDKILKVAKTKTDELLAEYDDNGKDQFKTVHNKWKEFRQAHRDWSKYTDITRI